MQMYESIALVIGQVLGGKPNSTPRADPSRAPKTSNELEAAMSRVFG